MGNKFSKKKVPSCSEDGRQTKGVEPVPPSKSTPSAVSVPTNVTPTPDSKPSESPALDQASKVCSWVGCGVDEPTWQNGMPLDCPDSSPGMIFSKCVACDSILGLAGELPCPIGLVRDEPAGLMHDER